MVLITFAVGDTAMWRSLRGYWLFARPLPTWTGPSARGTPGSVGFQHAAGPTDLKTSLPQHASCFSGSLGEMEPPERIQ